MEFCACRICLSRKCKDECVELNDVLKEKLKECVREINLEVNANPTLCYDCHSNLLEAHAFRNKCLSTELRIGKYISTLDNGGGKINLELDLDKIRNVFSETGCYQENTLQKQKSYEITNEKSECQNLEISKEGEYNGKYQYVRTSGDAGKFKIVVFTKGDNYQNEKAQKKCESVECNENIVDGENYFNLHEDTQIGANYVSLGSDTTLINIGNNQSLNMLTMSDVQNKLVSREPPEGNVNLIREVGGDFHDGINVDVSLVGNIRSNSTNDITLINKKQVEHDFVNITPVQKIDKIFFCKSKQGNIKRTFVYNKRNVVDNIATTHDISNNIVVNNITSSMKGVINTNFNKNVEDFALNVTNNVQGYVNMNVENVITSNVNMNAENVVTSNVNKNFTTSTVNKEVERVISTNIYKNVINSNLDENVITSNVNENVITSNINKNIITSNVNENVLNSNVNKNVINSNLNENVITSNVNDNDITSNVNKNVITSNVNENVLASNVNKNTITSTVNNKVDTVNTSNVNNTSNNQQINNCECNICGKVFENPLSLLGHIDTHAVDKNVNDIQGFLKCSLCWKLFENLTSFKQHLQKEHIFAHKKQATDVGTTKSIKTEFVSCSSEATDDNSFLKEESSVEKRKEDSDIPSDDKFLCSSCGMCFKTKAKLRVHIRNHEIVLRYQCDICEEKFRYASSLKIHRRKHAKDITDERFLDEIFRCDICDKHFYDKNYLHKHMKKHGKPEFSCDSCNRTFYNKGDLGKHRRIHTGEKPYKCKMCDRSFRVSASLIRHTRAHTGEKPYICETCGKCFNQKYNLTSHMALHSNVKQYNCDSCSMRFRHKATRDMHVLKLHAMGRKLKCEVCFLYFSNEENLSVHKCRNSEKISGDIDIK